MHHKYYTLDQLKEDTANFNTQIKQELPELNRFGIPQINFISCNTTFGIRDLQEKDTIISLIDNANNIDRLRLAIAKKGKWYIKDEIDKTYLYKDWFKTNIEPTKESIIASTKTLINKYQAHNFYVLNFNNYGDDFKLIHYDQSFYLIHTNNLKNLQWDRIITLIGDISINDETLQIFQQNRVAFYKERIDDKKVIRIILYKKLTLNETNLIKRIKGLINNFNVSKISKDNLNVIDMGQDGRLMFSTILNTNNYHQEKILKHDGDTWWVVAPVINIERNKWSISTEYKQITQWLNELVALNETKELTDDELLAYLKVSYKIQQNNKTFKI